MKKKFLVATHGRLASGFQNSMAILADKGAELEVINAYLTNEDYTPIISNFIDSIEEGEQGIIFTDLFGGSVKSNSGSRNDKTKKRSIVCHF